MTAVGLLESNHEGFCCPTTLDGMTVYDPCLKVTRGRIHSLHSLKETAFVGLDLVLHLGRGVLKVSKTSWYARLSVCSRTCAPSGCELPERKC